MEEEGWRSEGKEGGNGYRGLGAQSKKEAGRMQRG